MSAWMPGRSGLLLLRNYAAPDGTAGLARRCAGWHRRSHVRLATRSALFHRRRTERRRGWGGHAAAADAAARARDRRGHDRRGRCLLPGLVYAAAGLAVAAHAVGVGRRHLVALAGVLLAAHSRAPPRRG